MPELPEVETVLRGIQPTLDQQRLKTVVVRQPKLRQWVTRDIAQQTQRQSIRSIRRRAKYLWLQLSQGGILIHLGMSGSLRLCPPNEPAKKHDHVDFVFDTQILRYRDPRRFGLVLWHPDTLETHPLLQKLGPEPLDADFCADYCYAQTQHSAQTIKQLLMNGHKVVGVGNIYASESLFRAGIAPHSIAHKLTYQDCDRITCAIKDTLTDAIAAGGSSLRDFSHSDGSLGYFQQQYFVYGRKALPCRHCGTQIQHAVLGQRATFWCPNCQKLQV